MTEQQTTAGPSPSTAVAEYTATEAALAELRSRLTSVVYDVTTTNGMEAAKKDRAEVRGLRVALEDKRKEIKAPALERCRLIDEEAKRITADLRALEEPIDAQIKAEEQRKEAEKAAKAEAERQRVARIRNSIDELSRTVVVAAGKSSEDIGYMIVALEGVATGPDANWEEFAAEAEGVKQGTLTKLREMHAAAEAQEDEAKRLAEQRAELARMEKEAAERRASERKAQEEEAARVKAEQDAATAKLKAEREEFERQQAEARRKADEERAEADRKAEAERARVAAIREVITTIRLAPTAAVGAPAEKIAHMRQIVIDTVIDEAFAEFEQEAQVAKAAAIESLGNMHGAAVAAENEAARLEAQRQEQEARERAEREQREAEEQQRQRRAQIAALTPPTAEEIVGLVALEFALGDHKTAAGWLAAADFKAFADALSETATAEQAVA